MPWPKETHPEIYEEIDRCFTVPEMGGAIIVEDRILIVGTYYEVRKLEKTYGKEYQGKYVDYTSSIYSFWESFFRQTKQLSGQGGPPDSKVSIPEKIITTGFMRSRTYFAEAVDVSNKLKAITERFGIQIEFIEPFHR